MLTLTLTPTPREKMSNTYPTTYLITYLHRHQDTCIQPPLSWKISSYPSAAAGLIYGPHKHHRTYSAWAPIRCKIHARVSTRCSRPVGFAWPMQGDHFWRRNICLFSVARRRCILSTPLRESAGEDRLFSWQCRSVCYAALDKRVHRVLVDTASSRKRRLHILVDTSHFASPLFDSVWQSPPRVHS